MAKTMRLDKLLGHTGWGTRRELKELCKGGHVTVNGAVCRDSSQKIGIRQQIWRITDKKRLIFPFPIAWKKTGVISENTAGIKLAPMIGNAFFPIAMTSLLFEKTWSSCTGKKTKQITPTSINTQENP